MFSRMRISRGNDYRMTTLELLGPSGDLQLRFLSPLGPRERRAFLRSFFMQMRPWLNFFRQCGIDHSSDGWIRNRRARARGVRATAGQPVSSLAGAFGYEIRMNRLGIGLTQAQLAQRLGIQRTHLSDIERGVYLPGPRVRAALEHEFAHPRSPELLLGKTRQPARQPGKSCPS